MVFGIGTSRQRSAGGRFRPGRLLAQSLVLALIVPTGLAQVALAAEPQGLGRPDLPKSRVTKVKTFETPDTKTARAKVAKERKANAEQAKQATAERKADWPKKDTATLRLKSGATGMSTPGGLPVAISPTTSPNPAPPLRRPQRARRTSPF